MYVKENLKKTFEAVTGLGKLSLDKVRQAVRGRKPQTTFFEDDGNTPNNPTLPLIYYRTPVRLKGVDDPAAIFEELFRLHSWRKSWRNGIYGYLHYHSRIHEVLGIARGHARVRFGGNKGKVVEVHAGDVAILPAGTGHQLFTASPDLLVVGAYPPEGTYDLCKGTAADHSRALKSIPEVAIPASDPIYGKDGGLTKIWQS